MRRGMQCTLLFATQSQHKNEVILPARLAALKKKSDEIQRKIVAAESELAASQLWP
jgi:hypothetical protein